MSADSFVTPSCTSCGKQLMNYDEAVYDGPMRDGRPDPAFDRCDPFMEWATLCRSCYDKLIADTHRDRSSPNVR